MTKEYEKEEREWERRKVLVETYLEENPQQECKVCELKNTDHCKLYGSLRCEYTGLMLKVVDKDKDGLVFEIKKDNSLKDKNVHYDHIFRAGARGTINFNQE